MLLGLREKKEPRSDQELIAAFKEKQDQKAADTLIQRHLHNIYTDALSFLKNREDAKDATMQLCGTLKDKIRTYEVEYFSAWLSKVTRNHCLELLRKKNRLRTEELDEKSESIFVDFPDFDPLNEENDPVEQLIEAIDKLSPKQRSCIIAFYLKELSYKEVAQKTGFTLGEVKTHLQNGRRNLRNQLS